MRTYCEIAYAIAKISIMTIIERIIENDGIIVMDLDGSNVGYFLSFITNQFVSQFGCSSFWITDSFYLAAET